MKATGIVRRIDDLGRVVIPKEIRRTLRIREGDPLEIFTQKDGEVIFKKYSPMGGLGDSAVQMCETLAKTTDCATIVCDRDTIIAVAGAPKKDLHEHRISSALEKIMETRKVHMHQRGESMIPVVDGIEKYGIAIAAPILAEGDVMGCIVFLVSDTSKTLGEVEHKLAQTVAAFLGKQMEQ